MLSATVWAGHALFGVVPDESTPLTRIALGSCARQNLPQPIWEPILASEPDLFVFLGDNIYGDSEDMEVLRRKYAQLDAKPGFQKLRQSIPILATWDDHDYGEDNGGIDFPMKDFSQSLFLDFIDEPLHTPRRSHDFLSDSRRPCKRNYIDVWRLDQKLGAFAAGLVEGIYNTSGHLLDRM